MGIEESKMKFLKQALYLAEADDLSELPPITMKDIQSNISKGAKDIEQNWANALELVHKAYSVSKVQRPKPGMAAGWKQYEENITYAVQQLAKARGMKSDWRMSASSLREAINTMESGASKYNVHLQIPNTDPINATVEASDISMIIDMVKDNVKKDPEASVYEMRVEDDEDEEGAKITFWLHGIRDNAFVKITPA